MWAAVCGCTPAVMLLPARLKRALACTRKLRTHLGRVIREIERQTEEPSVKLDKLLQTAHRIEEQQRQDKNRIYSVHEPEVQCIAKGKAGKQYRLDELVELQIELQEESNCLRMERKSAAIEQSLELAGCYALTSSITASVTFEINAGDTST